MFEKKKGKENGWNKRDGITWRAKHGGF